MKKLILLITIFLFIACVRSETSMILEYKDVQFFKVHETQRSPKVSLEVSGLAFHSSLAVNSLETKVENNSMVVLVHMTVARNGLRGDFDYVFDIPERVNFVYFGTKRKLIWKRENE